jgi:hypothetical protein
MFVVVVLGHSPQLDALMWYSEITRITESLTALFISIAYYRCCFIKNCDYPWSCNRGHVYLDYLHHMAEEMELCFINA